MSQRVGLRHISSMMRKSPYENLTTYTLVDPGNDITRTALRATIYTPPGELMGAFDNYKSRTTAGDFDIKLDINILSAGSGGGKLGTVLLIRLFLSSIRYCQVEFNWNYPSNNLRLGQQVGGGYQVSGTYSYTLGTPLYLTFDRISGSVRLRIYQDSARTNLLATLTLASTNNDTFTTISIPRMGFNESDNFNGYVEKVLVTP